jgi:lipopolysaccharide biosynthesis regulator YciM
MFRVIVLFVIAAVVLGFLSKFGGDAEVTLFFSDYEISLTQGVLFFLLLASFLLVLLVVFVSTGSVFFLKVRNVSKNNQKYKLTLDYVAQFLTDNSLGYVAGSEQVLKKIRRSFPKHPLTAFLMLQNSKLTGDSKMVDKSFKILLKNEDTKILALQGMANKALKGKDLVKAQKLLEESYKTLPKSKNIVESLVDIYKRTQNWGKVVEIIKDTKGLFADFFFYQELGIAYLMLARCEDDRERKEKYLKLAKKHYPEHGQIQLEFVRYLAEHGKKHALGRYVKKIVNANIDREIVDVYLENLSSKKEEAKLGALIDLFKINDKSEYVFVKLVEEAIVVGEKKAVVEKLIEKNLYNFHARILYDAAVEFFISIGAIEGNKFYRNLLEDQGRFKGDFTYECEKCGEKYERWEASCGECEGFNKIGFFIISDYAK